MIDAVAFPLQRGDLLEIVWVDIYEDVTGNPDKAQLAKRTSYGLFWSRGISYSLPTLVTTSTLDESVEGQSGMCVYPIACIVGLKVLRKAKKARVRKRSVSRRPGADQNVPAADPAEEK